MSKFNIRKSYEGFPSKTINDYETFENIETAQHWIRFQAERWAQLGGYVTHQTDDKIVCMESDDSQEITFEIYETPIY